MVAAVFLAFFLVEDVFSFKPLDDSAHIAAVKVEPVLKKLGRAMGVFLISNTIRVSVKENGLS